MRRNILAVVIAVVLAGTGVCAEVSLETKMLNDLFHYVYQCEMMYSDVLWALDYVDKFDRERSWESLQLARVSIVVAKSDVEKLNPPVPEMTAEEHMSFVKRGIDVSFLENIGAEFKAEQTSWLNTLTNLNNGVMYEVLYLKDDWDICMRNATNTRKLIEAFFQYLANQ